MQLLVKGLISSLTVQVVNFIALVTTICKYFLSTYVGFKLIGMKYKLKVYNHWQGIENLRAYEM